IYFGSGMSNGNAHDRNNAPCAVIGGANGRLKGNRHIAVENKEPTANLLLAFAVMANAEVEQIGHSTGRLSLWEEVRKGGRRNVCPFFYVWDRLSTAPGLQRPLVESIPGTSVQSLLHLVLGLLVFSGGRRAPGGPGAGGGKDGRGDPTPAWTRQVQTTLAEEKAIDQLVVVTGSLAADREIVLGFKVPGRLADIPVDLGSS